MTDEVKDLPLESIYWIDETDITEEQIKNQATSLMVHGLIEPIVVCPKDEKGHRGVIGRLRYEGMKYRWRNDPEGKTILSRIHTFKSEMEIKMWQLAENLHRRRLPAMQKARQLQDLFDIIREEADEEATLQTLAAAIEDSTGNKESVKTLQHYLSLTKLAPKTQAVLTSEKLGIRYGLELLRVKDEKKQEKIAKGIQDHPDRFDTVQSVKWRVDEIVEKERKKKHKKRLQKKAETLRAEGKIVVIDSSYSDLSYEEREKYKRFWNEPFPKCSDCPNFGILLTPNFQQKPLCADPSCYKKLDEEKDQATDRILKERKETLDKERAGILSMEPDERHWRLAVVGLIEPWPLARLLELDRQSYDPGGMLPAIWKKVQSMSEEECKQLLIKKAVEAILTGPQQWDKPAKKWAVKEFKLTRAVFLREEEA